ncbi:hypothetical protein GMB86_06960 [Terrilactibacillus sp. BCM23-1]|uniref:PilN domain-containing protein n=1 Tax=Terrilactibacillus tamarindi TaxID=2599694 RepID=A0A6N8CNS4_9BACI|nr:hypothetical protein [Terrilactibacillus tamarindi]MTT31752.1 hypothetical protein [Terrilactibacillus tamarindi]
MIEINLLPYEKKSPKGYKYFVFGFIIFCLITAAGLGFYTWKVNHKLSEAHARLSSIKASVLEPSSPGSEEVTPETALEALEQNRIRLYSNLVSLDKPLPKGSTIDLISYDSSKVTINYTVSHFDDMKTYVDRLRKASFENVVMNQAVNSKPNQDGTYSVQIELTLPKSKEQ